MKIACKSARARARLLSTRLSAECISAEWTAVELARRNADFALVNPNLHALRRPRRGVREPFDAARELINVTESAGRLFDNSRMQMRHERTRARFRERRAGAGDASTRIARARAEEMRSGLNAASGLRDIEARVEIQIE